MIQSNCDCSSSNYSIYYFFELIGWTKITALYFWFAPILFLFGAVYTYTVTFFVDDSIHVLRLVFVYKCMSTNKTLFRQYTWDIWNIRRAK